MRPARGLLGLLLGALLVAESSAGPLPAPAARAEPAAVAASSPPAAPADTLALLAGAPRPVRDPIAIASRLAGAPIARAALEPIAGPLAVGRRDTFHVLDQSKPAYVPRAAELRAVSERAYWYVEAGQQVALADLERSAAHFDGVTYPTVHRYFGSEPSPGIDGDPRITVFIGTVPGVGAYFSNWDAYSRAVFRYSNEREMVHVNLGGLRPGTSAFDSTLAHEFQHLVHWHQQPGSETWLDEGFAELASSLAVPGRSAAGGQLERDPDVQLTAWNAGRSVGAHYQASFLFAHYLKSRFGPEAPRGILAEGGRPPESIDRFLARVAPDAGGFDGVFGDWVVANLLDDPRVADGRYAHEGIEHRATIGARAAVGGEALAAEVRQYGADYVELTGDGGDAELRFEGDATVRLVGADPPSGGFLWWSDRADGLDSTMTRRFDLGGVASATLRFNLWYDTERDYDYLYVMASTDEGRTWRVLDGALADDANPVGNAVGPGYTGRSGGGSNPAWVAESIDLTPFAGGPVLVRFEYVTDQATNYRGALVDDVAVPEIGYADDAEGDTGWSYEGFLRSDNTIPQRWGLRLVEFRRGGGVAVRPLTVGADGALVERLPSLGGDVERAVLVVSGLAPRTLETARYRVSLRAAP